MGSVPRWTLRGCPYALSSSSIVGFDDLPIAKWVGPPLTTIRQPLPEMGAAAARLAMQLNDGEPILDGRIELATELIVRESTAPPAHTD